MGGLFGGGKHTTSGHKAMGIDFQGAQYGNPIPVVYGQAKVPGNCIWYGDFVATAQTQKTGKGGGGSTTTSYTYSASFQIGLCEGTIASVVNIFNGSASVSPSSISAVVALGTSGQAPWAHLTGTAALGYSKTAVISIPNLKLGSSPSLPNYNYEVAGLFQYGGGVVDANPKDILTDILTDTDHGVVFPYLGSLTQYSNYCVANGLFLSPSYDTQQDATAALNNLFKYTNSYVYYSDDQLKVVPLGDVAVTGNGVTYTPNNTPVVNLGQADFICALGSSPIHCDRKAPQDCLNLVRLNFEDRANTYHTANINGTIDQDMIVNGERSDATETVNMVKTSAVAKFIAQNLVQRAFYIRNSYSFTVGWRYCYLEPTDIVTLTDVTLNLNAAPVRILSIEENQDGELNIVAEEFPIGVGHAAQYGTQANNGTSIDTNVDPGAVNPPYLFRGPGFLVSNNAPEIWCAVNGSNQWWAAADVYISRDNTTFTYSGTIGKPARYGSLNNTLASHADPDSANTPQVTVYAPATLTGCTTAEADNFNTLCMIDTEVMSYSTVGFVSTGIYNLSYLRRGGYGSAIASHSPSAPFVRLDDAIWRMPVDPSTIGQTIYVKFLSINSFGRTPRTLASETAYTYVIGTNVELPDVPPTPGSIVITPVADGVNIAWSNSNPQAVGATSIEFATTSGGTYTVLGQVGPTGNTFPHHFVSGNTYWYRLRARGPLVQSGWSAYSTAISSTGKTASPVPGFNLIANPGFESNQIGTAIGRATLAVNSAITDWWKITAADSTYQVYPTNQATRFSGGAQAIEFLVGDGQTIPTGNSSCKVQSTAPFPVTPGSILQVGGMLQLQGGFAVTGCSCSQIVQLQFLNASGSNVGTLSYSTSTFVSGFTSQTASGVVPAAAVTAYMECVLSVSNVSGSAKVVTVGQYFAIPDFDDLFVYQQLGNQATIPPINVANYGAKVPAVITYTAAAGTPATATISVASFSVTAGSVLVNYNAMSVGTTGTNNTVVTYYIYLDDPTYSGGTKTLIASTTALNIYQNNGRIYLGSVAVTYPLSGTGGGSGGNDGYCVCDEMFVLDDLLAAEVVPGDILDCINLPRTGIRVFNRRVDAVEDSEVSCVRITTANGAVLECSSTTPFDLLGGRWTTADKMAGEFVVTDQGIDAVKTVEEIGIKRVCNIHVGGMSYAAGADAANRIYSHNSLKP